MEKFGLVLLLALAAVCGAAARPGPRNSLREASVFWIVQKGLDCRGTCREAGFRPVPGYPASSTDSAPPLLCAHIGALVSDPALQLPGSLQTDAYKFFISEGYTRPQAGDKNSGREPSPDSQGCTSYLEKTTPTPDYFYCGCLPVRRPSKGGPVQKSWRWVPSSTSESECKSVNGDNTQGAFHPYACRVHATGMIGHLNSVNCGFPYAQDIPDCQYGWQTTQPASKYTDSSKNMPLANADFPKCVYSSRSGLASSQQESAGFNEVDRLCILANFNNGFKYKPFSWPKSPAP